jgi:hypothetical protein
VKKKRVRGLLLRVFLGKDSGDQEGVFKEALSGSAKVSEKPRQRTSGKNTASYFYHNSGLIVNGERR